MSYPIVPTPPPGWLAHPSAPGYYYNPGNPAEMVQLGAPPAPVAPPPPAAVFIPHPNAPGWEYNPSTGEQRQVAAAMPAPAGAVYAAVYATPVATAPTYGRVDPGLAAAELARSNAKAKKDGEVLYLDFPELPEKVGSKLVMNVRLLPPCGENNPAAWATGARHRLYSKMDPNWQDNWKGQFFFPECSGDGCEVCAAVSDCATSGISEAEKFADDAKADERHYWQGIDLDDPAKHFKQEMKDGVPVMLPNGQPSWLVIPGIIAMRRTLGRKLLSLHCDAPNLTDPDRGVNVRLIKERTARGVYPMNVQYDAHGDMGGPTQLDPALRPVLANLHDLSTVCIKKRSAEDMKAIAKNIRDHFRLYAAVPSATAVAPGTERWQKHPSNPAYEWNPATGATRLASAAPVPPFVPPPYAAPAAPAAVPPYVPPVSAPMPPPPPPAAAYAPPAAAYAPPPMVAPPPPYAMPPVAGYAPPPMPPALPPPVAPGFTSGAVVPPPYAPVGVAASPMPGLPPLPTLPQLPPMVGGPIGAPPALPPMPPVGMPGAPLTPAQIEASLAVPKTDDIPF